MSCPAETDLHLPPAESFMSSGEELGQNPFLHPRRLVMDDFSIPNIFGGQLFAGIFFLLWIVQAAWYIAVIVFLYRIWKKVKHLPAS
jgi:hypothetical protein